MVLYPVEDLIFVETSQQACRPDKGNSTLSLLVLYFLPYFLSNNFKYLVTLIAFIFKITAKVPKIANLRKIAPAVRLHRPFSQNGGGLFPPTSTTGSLRQRFRTKRESPSPSLPAT